MCGRSDDSQIYPLCVHILAHSFIQRESHNPLHINHFRTLSIATGGVRGGNRAGHLKLYFNLAGISSENSRTATRCDHHSVAMLSSVMILAPAVRFRI